MCEFTVFLDGREVCKYVVHAKVEECEVIVKDVLGSLKSFKGCKIVEVDVISERLVLSSSAPVS